MVINTTITSRRPRPDPNSGINNPGEFDRLLPDEKRAVLKEISAMIEPAGKVLPFQSTYSLKHRLSMYITNGAIKGACLALGFRVVDESRLNWQLYARLK